MKITVEIHCDGEHAKENLEAYFRIKSQDETLSINGSRIWFKKPDIIKPKYRAYLCIICNKDNNQIERVEIWSSPEWDQTRVLKDKYCWIAYITEGSSFQEAHDNMIIDLSYPQIRYHFLKDSIANYDLELKAAQERLNKQQ